MLIVELLSFGIEVRKCHPYNQQGNQGACHGKASRNVPPLKINV
jgi:hypothetical protein